MKKRAILLASFLVLTGTIAYLVAAPSALEFLDDHTKLASSWHMTSVVLRVLLFTISVIGAVVAAIQAKQFRLKTTLTVVLSLLVAVLNAGTAFFFSDYRTYEKAYVMYDSEIEAFKTSFESQDLTDDQILQEFTSAKLDLIERLRQIRIGLIEGKVASTFELVPDLYAQDKTVQWSRRGDPKEYVFAAGQATDPKKLAAAKAIAMKAADDSIIAVLRGEMAAELGKQGISAERQKQVLDMLFDPEHNAVLLSYATVDRSQFGKSAGGYSYSVVKKIPRNIVAYYYSDVVSRSDTLKKVEGFSAEKLMTYLNSQKTLK